jgi:hypothetical protein
VFDRSSCASFASMPLQALVVRVSGGPVCERASPPDG